ncbi:hypothetical protein V4Z26_001275 [Vibrio alginolyticus]
MALTMDYQRDIAGMEQTLLIKDAYWRVKDIQGSKQELLVNVEVRERADSKGTVGLFSFVFEPDSSGVNYHEQAYEHLKTLELFKGAKDS